jgi:hypothetical protein
MDGENSKFKFQISRKREPPWKRSGREKRGQDVPATDWDCKSQPRDTFWKEKRGQDVPTTDWDYKSQPRDTFWKEKRGQDVPTTDWDYKSQPRDAFFSSAACHGVRVA